MSLAKKRKEGSNMVINYNPSEITFTATLSGLTKTLDNGMHKIYKKEMLKRMGVEKIIQNDKAVIVVLTNGNKGVAICDGQDYFDPLIGFSVAYAMAVGTKGNKKQFKNNVEKILK